MLNKLRFIAKLTLLYYLVFILLGCSTTSVATTPSPTATPAAMPITPTPEPEPTVPPPAPEPRPETIFSFTHHRLDGNRLVPGQGALPDVTPIDIPLAFVPQWVVAAPIEGGSLWVAVMFNGQVQAFQVIKGTVKTIPIMPERLPPGMPPLLRVDKGIPSLVVAPSSTASQATHPVILPSSGAMAFIEGNGDLVIWDDKEVARLALNVLPDARLLVDEKDRLLLLTDRTTRYAHQVLGDEFEAASITLVETNPMPRIALTISLPEPNVIEGIVPIWVDVSGDNTREIIVTMSNEIEGARLVVFNEAGEQIITGPAIGQGYRWRHQLAVAPFGPAGTLEVVENLTPHIYGSVEFYKLSGDALQMTAQIKDYTSHINGSINLDMGVAGDFDGDGHIELLLPFLQTRFELGGIRRTEAGVEAAWKVPVGGRMLTNLATVTLDDGTLAVGVGHDGLMLRIWQP